MANKVANTRKVFNFAVEINGLNQFLVQNLELPDVEIVVTEHGDVNYKVKTGGQLKVGNMKLEKIKPFPNSDTWAWDWLKQVQDPVAGGGDLPSNYKQLIVIRELGSDNITTGNFFTYDGCFPIKINQNKFDRMSSDNQLESVELSVDIPTKQ